MGLTSYTQLPGSYTNTLKKLPDGKSIEIPNTSIVGCAAGSGKICGGEEDSLFERADITDYPNGRKGPFKVDIQLKDPTMDGTVTFRLDPSRNDPKDLVSYSNNAVFTGKLDGEVLNDRSLSLDSDLMQSVLKQLTTSIKNQAKNSKE